MQTVCWIEEAIADLVEIIDYIEQRDSVAAESLHAAIVRVAETLPTVPYLYRPGRVPGTRECVVHPNYLLIYRVGDTTIDVLRVLHARQEYP